jgi:hypothetical protein
MEIRFKDGYFWGYFMFGDNSPKQAGWIWDGVKRFWFADTVDQIQKMRKLKPALKISESAKRAIENPKGIKVRRGFRDFVEEANLINLVK